MSTKQFDVIAVIEVFTGVSLAKAEEDTATDIVLFYFPDLQGTEIEAGVELLLQAEFTQEKYPIFYGLDYSLIYTGNLDEILSTLPKVVSLSK